MGAEYVILMEGVSVSGAITLIEFTAAADAIVEVISAWVSQGASETSTQEVIRILRKTAVGTGTAFTPRLLSPNTDAAFGGTARTNMTAEGTAGDILHREGFNILNGFFYKPVPDERIIVPPSGILGIGFAVAPAAAITISAGMIIREIG